MSTVRGPLIWDLETSHLKADFGTLLACGFSTETQGVPQVLSLKRYGVRKDPLNDKRLVAAVKEKLEAADIWVTYNGKRFDLPFIQAKCLEHGLGALPNTPHIDLYQDVVRPKLALARKSLGTVGYFLNLPAQKTPVEGRIWKRAISGDPEAIAYIVEHCAGDIILTEQLYLVLRPLVRMHPWVLGLDGCRVCGGKNLQRRGRAVSVLRGPRIRLQCQDCGAWENRPLKEVMQHE